MSWKMRFKWLSISVCNKLMRFGFAIAALAILSLKNFLPGQFVGLVKRYYQGKFLMH